MIALNLAVGAVNFQGISQGDRNRLWGAAGICLGATTFALTASDEAQLVIGLGVVGIGSMVLGLLRFFEADKSDQPNPSANQWRPEPAIFRSVDNEYSTGVTVTVGF